MIHEQKRPIAPPISAWGFEAARPNRPHGLDTRTQEQWGAPRHRVALAKGLPPSENSVTMTQRT
jgi:hypothetical protein